MRLYLVRHGETQVNQRGVYSGSTDHALNSQGIVQAELLAKALSGIQFDRIVTSGLRRTQQTAEYISGIDKQHHQRLEGLDEIHFGLWEGRHYQELEQNDSQNYANWCLDWKSVAPPEGESFNQFNLRIHQSFTAWLSEAEATGLDNILFVGHQGTLRCILLSLMKMPAEGFWYFTFRHDAYSVIDIHQGHAVIQQLNVLA
ncbi:histidine phosphatase family protein [Budviciaceae bacterium BWR-B9]|uniref:Histidine phosphatase family protein n=1 Tax=Limnobaculum allomyrinae TaxID=2791986 RepID=A0ABS1ILN0_9GAMM|nr:MULTISPECIES: histidine phosphatase family protein [Limnobaculum]MBK5142653.1 histidine phosphatase family protein [Limnobaculum allomyrinae]MBV7690461.1 histidine phosphatase family protein [Limnobaculum sp. M2-1]